MGEKIKKILALMRLSKLQNPIKREGYLEALRTGCRELQGNTPEDVIDMLQQEVAEMYQDIDEPDVFPYIEGYEMGIRALQRLFSKTQKQHR